MDPTTNDDWKLSLGVSHGLAILRADYMSQASFERR